MATSNAAMPQRAAVQRQDRDPFDVKGYCLAVLDEKLDIEARVAQLHVRSESVRMFDIRLERTELELRESGFNVPAIIDNCNRKFLTGRRKSRPYDGPLNDANVLKRFIKPAAERLKYKVNWRSLRTSCATWMVQAGADPKSVQGQMRHSRISTTMDIYAQFVPKGQKRAAQKMTEYVEKESGPNLGPILVQ